MKRILSFGIRVMVGLVFTGSGFLKLLEPSEVFRQSLVQYQIFSVFWAKGISRGLPWLEYLFGLLFLLGLNTTVALAVLWILNTLFIGVLASVVLRHIPLEGCGCFGGLVHLSVRQALRLDMILWLMLIYYAWDKKNKSQTSVKMGIKTGRL